MACRLDESRRELAWKVYIADVLMIVNNNIANGLAGDIVETKYLDLFVPDDEVTETAEEIIDRIKRKVREVAE